MPYDINNDPYIDPKTGVLRNLLDISNEGDLEYAEAQLTTIEISTLLIENSSKLVNFDLSLLCKINKQLFNEIYDWAGKFRTIDMEKENTRFAHAPYIADQTKKLLDGLADEKYLANLDKEKFVDRLAHYYSELNVVHPFREGNGRTLRTFFSLLAAKGGWDIAWEIMDSNENIQACKAGYVGNEDPLCIMFNKLVNLK